MPSHTAGPDGPSGERVLPDAAPRWRVLLVLGTLFLVAAALPVTFLVQGTLKQYRDAGALDVLWAKLALQGTMFAAGFLVAFGLVKTSLVIAYRVRPDSLPQSLGDLLQESYRASLERHRPRVERFVPGLVGFFAGATMAGQWRQAALWWHATTFGVDDPFYGKDAGFYVFTLPWLHFLCSFCTMCLVMTLVAAVAAHVFHGGIAVRGIASEDGRRTTRAARRHLCTVLAALFVVRGLAAVVARDELAQASGSRFGGITYTAERLVEPAQAVVAIAAMCVAGLLVSVWRTDAVRVPLTGAAVFVVLSTVGLDVVAPLYDRMSVQPNAVRLEQLRARQAMTAQNEAFGLTSLRQDNVSARGLSAAARAEAETTVAAVAPGEAMRPERSSRSNPVSAADALSRAAHAAPWLRWDQHPYEVTLDGRRTWLLDGYTTSSSYPGAQVYRFGGTGSSGGGRSGAGQGIGVNYVRNVVKATVDDRGRVVMYAWDARDPILRAWRGVFHPRLRAASALPSEIRDQLRYPADLFTVQRDVLERYHVRSAEDLLEAQPWQPAVDPQAQPVGTPAEPIHGPTSVGKDERGLTAALVTGGDHSRFAGLLVGTSSPTGPRLTLASAPDAGGDALPDPGEWSKGLLASAQHEVGGKQKLSDVVSQAQRRESVRFEPVRILRSGTGVLYVQYVTSRAESKGAKSHVIAVAVHAGHASAWATSAQAALGGVVESAGNGSARQRALDQAQQALDDANLAQSRGDDAGYREAEKRLQAALDGARRG